MAAQTLPPRVDVDVRPQPNDVLVVRLDGPVVVRTAPDVRRAVDAAVDRSPRAIVIDLDTVSEIDTAGLAAVTAPALRGRRASIEISMVAPSGVEARRLVDRVGVVPILNRAGR
jgi:anti-anti-sigma factor